MNTYVLKLDLNKGPTYSLGAPTGAVTIRQGDKLGTSITAELYDHGERVTTTGLTGYIVIPLPDRQHYYRKQGTYANGTVEVTIDETEAASVPGSTDNAYIELRQGSTVIASTQSFRVTVLRDAMAGMTPGETYDSEIEQVIEALGDAVDSIPDMVDDWLDEHPEVVAYRPNRPHATLTGSPVTASDAAPTTPISMTIHGRSVQDGTPTPSVPVAITSIDAASVVARGRNLAKPVVGGNSNRGITATVGSDGWITLSGKSTASTSGTISIGLTKNAAKQLIPGAQLFSLYLENEGALVTDEVELQVYGSDGVVTTRGGYAVASRTFDVLTEYISRICVFVKPASNGKTYSGRFRFSLVEGSVMPTTYIPPEGSDTAIDLDGHELRSLPDGTRDELTVDAEGHVTLVQRVQLTTQAVTDGVTGTVGTDVMSSTGEIADGATVLYPLATPTTVDLGIISLPELPAPDLTVWPDTDPTTTMALTYERDATMALAELMQMWSNVAPIEGDTASTNYAQGSYLMHDGQLCKVTTAIASGEAITIGTNVVATTVMAEVIALTA